MFSWFQSTQTEIFNFHIKDSIFFLYFYIYESIYISIRIWLVLIHITYMNIKKQILSEKNCEGKSPRNPQTFTPFIYQTIILIDTVSHINIWLMKWWTWKFKIFNRLFRLILHVSQFKGSKRLVYISGNELY